MSCIALQRILCVQLEKWAFCLELIMQFIHAYYSMITNESCNKHHFWIFPIKQWHFPRTTPFSSMHGVFSSFFSFSHSFWCRKGISLNLSVCIWLFRHQTEAWAFISYRIVRWMQKECQNAHKILNNIVWSQTMVHCLCLLWQRWDTAQERTNERTNE